MHQQYLINVQQLDDPSATEEAKMAEEQMMDDVMVDDQSIGLKYVLIDMATGQQFDSNSYSPLINTKITGVKDVFKSIKNDRELDSEISRIAQTLADDKTADWK